MNVIVIETSKHYDTLKTILKILHKLNMTIHLISPDFPREFSKSEFCIHYYPLKGILSFKRSIKKIRKADLMIINTLQGFDMILYTNPLRKLKCESDIKIILGVHNIFHNFFSTIDEEDREKVLKFTVDDYKQYYKLLRCLPDSLLRILFSLFFRKMSQKFSHIIDGTITFGEYVIHPEWIPNVFIPTRLAERDLINKRLSEKYKLIRSSKITFVIPGAVAESRRDYDILLDALKRIHMIENIEIVLLGRLLSKRIEEKLKNHPLKNNIKTFRNFVDEAMFHNIIISSHYVLAPIKYSPPYGKYKTSGNIADAFSHGVPLIIPESFAPDYSFNKGILRYPQTPEGLQRILEKSVEIVRKGEYEKIFNEAIEVSKEYTIEKVSERFEKFLEDVINRR